MKSFLFRRWAGLVLVVLVVFAGPLVLPILSISLRAFVLGDFSDSITVIKKIEAPILHYAKGVVFGVLALGCYVLTIRLVDFEKSRFWLRIMVCAILILCARSALLAGSMRDGIHQIASKSVRYVESGIFDDWVLARLAELFFSFVVVWIIGHLTESMLRNRERLIKST